MSKQTPETRTKEKLARLVRMIDGVVTKELDNFKTDEINYALENFSNHLKYDLGRDFEKRRTDNLKESPFDDLFDNQ